MSIKMIREISSDCIYKNFINTPLIFIPNKGQIDSNAQYYVRGASYGFYFSPEEAILSFVHRSSSETNRELNGVALALKFLEANPDTNIEGLCQGTGKVNFFEGKDQSKWVTNLPTYEKIIYKELWPNIDLVFYGKDNSLKYDFILRPGASVENIKLTYKGSNGISLDDKGNLLIHNDLGVLIDEKPISYQEIEGERVMIESGFEIKKQGNDGDHYGFRVLDKYNQDHTLVIDPGLIFSTFLGALSDVAGTNEDNKLGIAVDKGGNVYVTGGTISTSFPVTLGAFQEVFPSVGNNVKSAYVAKLRSDGSGLIYSTFLGGSNDDEARSIAIDKMGNAYVTGQTDSPDFPVTLGAFQEVFPSINGNLSAFITKVSSDGSRLIYSTFLGGSDADEGTDIAVDNMCNAYITGETNSPDFPVTLGAFQEDFPSLLFTSQPPPDEDDDSEVQQFFDDSVFVTKLNTDGSGLVYSTFLGGSGDDEGLSIAVDYYGNAYVSGETTSENFPTTLGAFQEVFAGDGDDAFVTKLNPDGSALVYSTFLGGSGDDEANSIAIDKMGNAYVGGETTSPDFPVTLGAFQEEFRADADAGFVTKLNPDGSALIYSTFLNGTDGDNEVQGIAVDDMGNAYVSGFSNSSDFPVTLGAFQEDFQGGTGAEEFRDAFVAKLNPDGSILLYSTFLGGSADDIARDIAIDQEGNAYVIGYTTSSNFPVTLGAFEDTFEGDPGTLPPFQTLFDTFVAKINPDSIL